MSRFKVTVERTYTGRHIHTRFIEAQSEAEAEDIVAAQLEGDEFDPTTAYDDSADNSGYDDCGVWHVEKAMPAEPWEGVEP